jgi:predicted nucleotidyltransferase
MTLEDFAQRIRATLVPSSGGLAAAFLFGSHAADRAHRESDVDVGVLLDRAVFPSARARFEHGLELSSALQRALGTRAVDLVVLNEAPPGLGRHVVTSGLCLSDLRPELTHAYVRDVQLRAADLDPFLRRTRAIKVAALAR